MSRQQYQRLESKGNPRLDTLELIANGLNSELLLVPNEKLRVTAEGSLASTTPKGPVALRFPAATLDSLFPGLNSES